MADAEQIRVVITGTAAELRKTLEGAGQDVESLGAKLRAIPDTIRIETILSTVQAEGKLGALSRKFVELKAQVESPLTPKADVAPLLAKLKLIEAEYDRVADKAARASLASSGLSSSDQSGLLGRLRSMFTGQRTTADDALLRQMFAGAGRGGVGGGGAAAGAGFFGGLGAAPLAIGGGALTGLIGSAGQALGGFGALAAAHIGTTFLGGILPLATVVKPMLGDLKNLTTALDNLQTAQQLYGKNQPALTKAQDNYNAAVQAFGPNSNAARSALGQLTLQQNKAANTAPQVVSAQQALNKQMLDASPATLQTAFAFRRLDEAMNTAGLKTAPAVRAVLVPLLDTFRTGLLPTLTEMAKIDLGGIATALRPLLQMMTSGEFHTLLLQMSQTFAQMMPMLFRDLTDVLMSFLRVAKAATPEMLSISHEITHALDRVNAFTSSSKLGPFIANLISQFRAWMSLIGAIGKLLFEALNAGSQSGKSVVQVFTQLIQAITPAVIVAFRAIAAVIGVVANAIISMNQHFSGIGKIIPTLVVGGAVLASWVALGGLVDALRLKLIALAEANPFITLLAIIGTAAAAVLAFGTAQSHTATTARELTDALDRQADAIRTLKNITLDDQQVKLAAIQANTAVAVAERNLANDRKQAHPDALQIKQDEEAVAQAKLDAARASADLANQSQKDTATQHQAATQIADTTKTARDRIQTIKDEIQHLGARDLLGNKNINTDKELQKKEAELKTAQNQLTDATKQGNKALTDSQSATDKAGNDFTTLANTITTAMHDGSVSVHDGLKYIGDALAKELTTIGVKWTAPALGLPGFSALTSKPAPGTTLRAGGGYIGSPGERGRDEVPAMLGRGEAVLHAGHQQIVNRALQKDGWTGGLSQLFATTGGLHYNFAAGGFSGGVAGTVGTGSGVVGGTWVRTGATIDPTQGQAPTFDAHGGFSFAELLEAGRNAGMRPDITALLGLPRGSFGMPMETAIDIRMPGSKNSFQIWKNDVGSGQPGDAHFTVDLHQAIASALGWTPNQDVEIARAGTDPNAAVTGGAAGAAATVAAIKLLTAPKVTGKGAVADIVRAVLKKQNDEANKFLQAHAPAPTAGSGGGFGLVGAPTLTGQPGVDKMIAEANSIAAHNYPYLWGGGHGTLGVGPYDCSGAVSAVLAADGLVSSPMVSGQFMNWGAPGPGKWVTIFSSPSHVFMQLAGRYFGTSGQNPGGGANWIPNFPGNIGAVTHPPGFGSGGFVPDAVLGGLSPQDLLIFKETGLLPGMAAGGFASAAKYTKPKAPKPSKPPKPAKHKHPKSPKHNEPFVPKDALKNLLTPDERKPDEDAHRYARQVTVFDQLFQNITGSPSHLDVDDPPLVTLTDADVKVLDPDGSLGYQAGDQIVNHSGMTVGRWFGPGGKIYGGTYHKGANVRLSELSKLLANRQPRLQALINERAADQRAVNVDKHALKVRQDREKRIKAFLHKNVQQAQVISKELDALKSQKLQDALTKALSKQAIAKRMTDLRGQLRTVNDELLAERHSQALLPSLARDPTHTQALEDQAANIRDAIAVEQELGRTGLGAVQAAQSAIYKKHLEDQLSGLTKTNVQLGGQKLAVGTGGSLGKLLKDMKTISDDRDTREDTLQNIKNVDVPAAKAEIASYIKEQADIGSMINIQVRSGDGGPDLQQLNDLLKQQLQDSQRAFSLSQAQFGVFAGFAPLLQGRLLGSYQSGINFVPKEGPYLLHRGEMVIPDPGGPAGNRAAATVHTAQGPIEIVIQMANNEPPLMKMVDARLNQKALQIVSDHAGQRARLMAGVRRP